MKFINPIFNELIKNLFFVTFYYNESDKPFCCFYSLSDCINYCLFLLDLYSDHMIDIIIKVNNDPCSYSVSSFLEKYDSLSKV